jgi:hypothetical protein
MVQLGRSTAAKKTILALIKFCSCVVVMATLAFAGDAAISHERSEQVTEHLAAGEFGPALKQALAEPDLNERATLLTQIAAAQQNAGEVEAATGTLRRIPRQANVANTIPGPVSFPGGGAQADFATLMTLIRSNTPSKWEDTDGEGGSMSPFQTGVKVSPAGLLQRLTTEEQTGQLVAMGIQARKPDLNDDVARQSPLRIVSLTRLEQIIARRIEEGLPIPETMAQLAGLHQVKFVMVLPETNEIVIAGPANGWQYDSQGRSVSLTEGRPTLQLDDLVTVLRTFARGNADFGCSINTRDEGIKSLKEFVEKSQSRGALSDGAVRGWVNQIQKKLGRQDVIVWGVPAESRVARVIVEADYRMKLVGINKLDVGKDVPGYFDLLPVSQQKIQPTMDALRWWLTIQCDTVLHSPDKNVFELRGSSVLCLSENQLVTAEGKHLPTGQSEATNRLFAENFTTHYPKLARKDLVFADAQNIFDMALCSALIQEQNLRGKTGWNMGVFAPDGSYAPASYAVPREVESVVNHRVYRGRDIVVQAAGGVRCNVLSIAKDGQRNQVNEDLSNLSTTAHHPNPVQGRWWWDVTK